MTKRGNKAAAILELLNKGVSGVNICRRLNVSPGYVSTLKKRMAHRAEEPRKPIGTMERKVPGGPATVVRATTEDRVEKILDERATTYGSFINVALFAQEMKEIIRSALDEQNVSLQADHLEALDMIASKIARIVIGDPHHVDSWLDIAGYAKLVADRLGGVSR